MSRSDSCSRPARRPAAVVAGAALVVLALATPAHAKVFVSQDEALALAFGAGSRPERRTAYLTDEQAGKIRDSAGTPPQTRVVVYYAGGPDPNRPELAFFDSHLVRTFPETVMIVVGADAKVRRVDILSFDEPEDYLPRQRWLDQFPGRGLDEDLSTRRAIRAVTGATLSSRAITDAVRRALALHAVLAAPPPTAAGEGTRP